jgi:signal peptidase I
VELRGAVGFTAPFLNRGDYGMRRRNNQYKIKRKKGKQIRRTGGLEFYNRKKKINLDVIREIIIWTGEIALVVVMAALIVYYFGYRVPVIGQSMEATLKNGEQVLVNRFTYNMVSPKPNDVIVFLPNGNEKSHYYIKRVIGVPGDTILIKEGTVYVNGEPFVEVIDNSGITESLMAEDEIVVGEDEFFVLGDNRNNSEDSRYANIGNVKREYIIGRAWFIISPFDRLGIIN